ncbi:minor capsid protein [Capybara microvirus Cap3_SP_554]|nr:minor capsid protein [Capybara microvirus Cap3_SP_554]
MSIKDINVRMADYQQGKYNSGYNAIDNMVNADVSNSNDFMGYGGYALNGYNSSYSPNAAATLAAGANNKITGNLDYARNIEMLERENAFNAAEASKVRDWEKMMSDTSYQRQAADLKAAGYNPALVLGNSGASVPSVGSAHSGNGGSNHSSSSIGLLPFLGSLLNSAFGIIKQNTYNNTLEEIAELKANTGKDIANFRYKSDSKKIF